jgi:hypothetical protein
MAIVVAWGWFSHGRLRGAAAVVNWDFTEERGKTSGLF